MSGVVWQDVVDQVIASSTTETNIGVGTVPAGEWPGQEVDIEQMGRHNVGNTSGRTYTIRLYVGSSGGAGGTKVAEYSCPNPGKVTGDMANWQRWSLFAPDASTLLVDEWMGYGGAGSGDGAFVTPTTPGSFLTNYVTGLSLSGAVEVRITCQLNVNSALHTFASRGVWALLLDEAATDTPYTAAIETDSAGIFSPRIGYTPATETDTAGAFQNLAAAYTAAIETDSARAFAVKLGYTAAIETDSAGTFASTGVSYSLAQETDTARPFGVKLGYGAATETDTARPVGLKLGYGAALETDTAGTFGGTTTPPVEAFILSRTGPADGDPASGPVRVSSRKGA